MLEELLYGLTAVGALVAAGLIVLILRALVGRRGRGFTEETAFREAAEETAVKEQPKPEPPPKPKSERERLSEREKQLADREAKLKAEKVKELEEREKVIGRKEDEVKGVPPEEVLRLEAERKRIQELIRKAEERFAGGGLEEKNFKRIVSDYQQQLIDIDVKLKRPG